MIPKNFGLREFFKDKLLKINKFQVSKNYLLDINSGTLIDNSKNIIPYDADGKILAFEDRQKTWFFDVADFLQENKYEDSGFIVLMIGVAYLESTQQFINGKSSKNNSSKFIEEALERIFPEMTKEEKDLFIDGVRCGMFHDGMLKKGIFADFSQKSLFHIHQDMLIINPYEFLTWTKRDFVRYIKLLKNKNNINERQKFEIIWDNQKGI